MTKPVSSFEFRYLNLFRDWILRFGILGLQGPVVGNETPGFHHIYKPRRNYQAKLKLPARIEVLDGPLPETDRYLLPGLKLSGNSRQIYGRAAKVPGVPEEYSVDGIGNYSLDTLELQSLRSLLPA